MRRALLACCHPFCPPCPRSRDNKGTPTVNEDAKDKDDLPEMGELNEVQLQWKGDYIN